MISKSSQQELRYYLFEPLNVCSAVAEAAVQLGTLGRKEAAQIDIRGDFGVVVSAHRTAFLVLLKCLLKNAIQAAPADSTIAVDIRASSLTIRDRGPGLPDAIVRNPGRWFPHGETPGEGNKPEIGLAITHTIARAHDWILRASNTEPGTCFTLTWTAEPPEAPALMLEFD